ncbi:hypothetical protein [Saccharothrix sp. HUAS TT1]|uniref:hypothetical protein n=1 Tax=unclassified Saccharothrix TaxID=2593673 RepID=UPI00345BA6AF
MSEPAGTADPDTAVDASDRPVTELTDDTVLTVAQFRRLYFLPVYDRDLRPKEIAVEALFGPFPTEQAALDYLRDTVGTHHPNWGPPVGFDVIPVSAPTDEAALAAWPRDENDPHPDPDFPFTHVPPG